MHLDGPLQCHSYRSQMKKIPRSLQTAENTTKPITDPSYNTAVSRWITINQEAKKQHQKQHKDHSDKRY